MSKENAISGIAIRRASVTDGPAAVAVLRRSITELCHADHQGNEQAVDGWLANKNEQTWRQWLARADAAMIVAEKDGAIAGIGMIDQRGEVLLNYVSPDARFSGISKAVLRALEDLARANGNNRCLLHSTRTARQFYLACGYHPLGDADKLEKSL